MNPFPKSAGGSRENLEAEVQEALAHLVLAAREDAAFRRQILLVLDLPRSQREAMVRTAVEAMRIKGEPEALRTAFLALATPPGAEAAARLIG
jgi:hypothetical protein